MKRISLIIFVIGVVLSSCSNLKKLPEGEKLYTGAKIRFRDKPQKQKALTQELEGLLRPKPNSKFLGMRVRLSLYNLGREPKPGKKGLNHLLRNKWGEPPVLFSSVRPEFTSRVLRNHLENNGYFEANSFFNIEHKEKTASVTYTIRAGQQYRINEVYFPEDSSRVSSILRESSRESLLKPGNPFNLDLIKEERERLDLALKEQGFFYFSPENLIIQVDSTLRGLVNLYIKVKDNTPVIVRHPYYINQVKIFANYSLTEDSALQEIPGRKYRNFILVDPDSLFKPSIFRRSVFLKPDSVYRRSSHNITLRRLVSLGPFKFIRADFDRIPDSSRHLLNATIYLTPYPKRTIQLQVNGSSKSNNFVASELRLQMKNRNWFRGAEMLELNFGGGYETQIGGEQLSTNSYTLNGDINVYFPSFVSPFKLINPRIPFVPRTRISAGFELLNRANLYTLRAIKGSYGYNWRQSTRIEHTFNPFTMSYTQPDNITAEFQQILDQDLALRQSFEKQFLIGGNYTLQFNNQTESKLWNTSFVEFEADVSGNLIGLIAKKSAVSGQKQIFGTPFAQYARLTTDARNYWKLNNRGLTWVNRIYAGVGLAYGNSEFMPFVKQYFIGGSNSLRAFRTRTLGPGSYQSNTSQLLASEAGDIKLEMNTELRMKLFSVVNGALFVDAGNIWLKKENHLKPGSGFSDWWKEMAVGAGVGLRIDASILVVRFDLAMPLRKPYLPDGERWVIDQISFGNPDWRKQNLILNIAIGYPF